MKRFLLLLVVLAATLSASSQVYYKCTGNNVNVRKGPGKNYSLVQDGFLSSVQLGKGHIVKFLGKKKNGFMYVEDKNPNVRYSFDKGWVSAQYLRPATKCRDCNGKGFYDWDCPECGGQGMYYCCYSVGKELCDECGGWGYK